MKILIVDDEYYVREGMQAILQTLPPPREILTAENGCDALDICRENAIDILITDIRMPGMDGLEMTEKLQQLGQNPVVMIVSGFDDFVYAQTAMRLGVVDFLLKPIDPDEFFQTVCMLCQRRQQSQEKEDSENRVQAIRYLRNKSEIPSRLLQNYKGGIYFLLRSKEQEAQFWEQIRETLPESLASCAENFCWLSMNPDEELLLAYAKTEDSYVAKQIEEWLDTTSDLPLTAALDLNVQDSRTAYDTLHNRLKNWFYTPQRELIQTTRQASQCLKHQDVDIRLDAIKRLLQRGSRRRLRNEINHLFSEFIAALYPRHDVIRASLSIEALCRQCLEASKEKAQLLPLKNNENMNIWQLREALEAFLLQYETLQYEGNGRQDNAIYEAVAYIQEHYSENISLAEIAKKVHLSQSYLSRKIKEVTQLGFSKYLLQLRMNKASLLLQKGYAVKQVAEMVGYNDYRQFSVQFREYTGCLPGKYAKEG